MDSVSEFIDSMSGFRFKLDTFYYRHLKMCEQAQKETRDAMYV
jgi:hypothetical protein